jgi:hypothetical protein
VAEREAAVPKTDLRSVQRAAILFIKLEESQLRLFVHMNTVWPNDLDDVMNTAEEFYNIAIGYVRGRFPGAKCRLERDPNRSLDFFACSIVTGQRTMDPARTVLATFEIEEFDLDTDENIKKYEEMLEESLGHELNLNKQEDW